MGWLNEFICILTGFQGIKSAANTLLDMAIGVYDDEEIGLQNDIVEVVFGG